VRHKRTWLRSVGWLPERAGCSMKAIGHRVVTTEDGPYQVSGSVPIP
jgi:hypothetical protein